VNIDTDNKIMGIYKITNIKVGKFYIGSSKDIEKRWKDHVYMLNRNQHHSLYFQNAWNKYGEDNFKFEIIEMINDESILLDREQYWLDKTQCYNSKIGYNISKSSRYTNINNKNEYKDIKNKKKNKKPKMKLAKNNKEISYKIHNTNEIITLQPIQDFNQFILDFYNHYKKLIHNNIYLADCKINSDNFILEIISLCYLNDGDIDCILNIGVSDLVSIVKEDGTILNIYKKGLLWYKIIEDSNRSMLIFKNKDKEYEIILSDNEIKRNNIKGNI
jgi:hypothetical protein